LFHLTGFTPETGSINLTPELSSHSKTQFSYSLGLGVDAQVNTKIRVGLGYRYSNFGSSSLGNGTVVFNDYQSPVPFALGNSNVYANQLIARISYVA
jgi:opacity protein-like surface antigen